MLMLAFLGIQKRHLWTGKPTLDRIVRAIERVPVHHMLKGGIPLALTALIVLTAFLANARVKGSACPCEATPEIKNVLHQLSGGLELDPIARGGTEAVLGKLRRLMANHPDNLFLHRTYQDISRTSLPPNPEALSTEYRQQLQEHPTAIVYQYLYARSLIGSQTPKAIDGLEKLLQASPDWAWAHLDLAEIYLTPNFSDQRKAQACLEGFMRLCPSNLTGYDHASEIEDPVFLRTSVLKLRALIGQRTDWEVLPYYRSLWSLQFYSSQPSEWSQVRKQVEQDLQRLRPLGLVNEPGWLLALRDGYKLLSDKAGQDWVREQLRAQISTRPSDAMSAFGAWSHGNPNPKLGDPPEKVTAHWQALLKVTDEWTQQWPDQVEPWYQRLYALRHLEDASPTVVENAGEALLSASARRVGASPPAFIVADVAELYSQHGVHLDQIPNMVRSAFAQSESAPKPVLDTVPQTKISVDNARAQVRCIGLLALTEAELKTGQLEGSRDALRQLGEELKRHPAEEPGSEIFWTAYQSKYWERMARLATLAKHPLDALAFYQSALQFVSDENLMLMDGNPLDRDRERAKMLWSEIGGSDTGWQAWLAASKVRKPQSANGLDVNWHKWVKPLPEFAVTDLQGRTWSLNDLKDQVTFVNVWATWCMPCRQELPLVQKLYERLRDRKGLLLVTVNIDDNRGFLEPYIKEGKFTFPVLPAPSLLTKIAPGSSMPLNWVVDRNGVIQAEYTGYEPNDDAWVEKTLATMDEIGSLD